MNLWKFSIRQVRRRPGRNILTLLSIVLGVGAIFAFATATQSARKSFDRMLEMLTGKADAEVVARGGGRFAEELLPDLTKIDSVKAAVPSFRQTTLLTINKKKVKVTALGIQPDKEILVRDMVISKGRAFKEPGEILFDEGLALSTQVALDDDVKMLTNRGLQVLKVVGFVKTTTAQVTAQGNMVYLELAELQDLSKADKRFNSLQLVFSPGSPIKEEVDRIAALLPRELEIRLTRNEKGSANITLLAFETGLDVASSFALFGAGLMILNTFLMNVTERRRQLAILRLIGATRGQIMRLLLREGLLLGLVGAALGLPAGWAMSILLAEGLGKMFRMAVDTPVPGLGTILISFATGPAVALIAAYFPARKAGQLPVLEGLRPQQASDRSGFRSRGYFGLALIFVACLTLFLAIQGYLTDVIIIPASLTFLVGCVTAFPLVLAPLCRQVAKLVGVFGTMEGELASRQVQRDPSRSNLTWGILFISVVASVGIGIVLNGVIADVRLWYTRSIMGDFLIRTTLTNLAGEGLPGLRGEIVAQIRQRPDVERMDAISFVQVEEKSPEGGTLIVVIRDFAGHEDLPMEIPAAKVADVRRGLLEGGVVLSDIVAAKLQRKAGDSITVQWLGKSMSFPIVGTTPNYTNGGSVLVMDEKVAHKAFGEFDADVLLISTSAEKRQDLANYLRELCLENGYLFQTYAEFEAAIEATLNTVVASLWGVLALGFFIAMFGVTNTLVMNVLEQTREIGLMRVVGMQRRQVRRMILAQSALLGILAIVPGAAGGMFLAHAMRSTTLASLGQNSHLLGSLPWVLPYALLVMLAVLAFGFVPAARAAKLNVLKSVRME